MNVRQRLSMTILILCAGIVGFAALVMQVTSTAIVLARVRGREIAEDFAPGLTLIRPVCGLENHIAETLGSTFRLDYPAYEIIFCVSHANDPAVPLIRRLIAQHPAAQARLMIGSERISDNPKLNNLAKGWWAARHDWVLMADSNVLLPADCVARLF
jgi:ceramide glucosyltransferase